MSYGRDFLNCIKIIICINNDVKILQSTFCGCSALVYQFALFTGFEKLVLLYILPFKLLGLLRAIGNALFVGKHKIMRETE